MKVELLKRQALSLVLESLLRNELKSIRHSASANTYVAQVCPDPWTDDLHLGEQQSNSLGCDSLELMRLAAATNEMFHLYEANQEIGLLSDPTFGLWIDAVQAAWRQGVSQITFTTSGSTGVPTRCTHDFPHLQIEIRFLSQIFADRTRVLTFAPMHHIYGFLFGAMLPEVLEAEVALQSTSAGDACSNFALKAGDLVVSFPERWRWLDKTVTQWPPNVCGVVSTAPCPPELIADLLGRGLRQMFEVYGSSESAGVGLRISPETRYRLMPHWEIVSSDEQHGTTVLSASGLQVRLMDRLCLEAEGRFTLGGRVDGAVQVGGTNVFPAHIASLLRNHPQVSDVMVRLMRPEEGSRLKAFVVTEAGVSWDALHLDLQVWCRLHLRPQERPTAITFGFAFPINDLGKRSDW